MWTYRPFQKMEDSFKDRKTIESADILVQTNIKGGKKKKKGNLDTYPICDRSQNPICV